MSMTNEESNQQSESSSTDQQFQEADPDHRQQQQSSDDSNKPKRNPFCSRCRNHGKSAQVKGHKRHCEYRDCQCEGCKLVECRQIVSAAQIKRRRDQKQDEECGRRIEISPPVLTREPANDPAALIAKTLIGSAAIKQQQQQHAQHQKSLTSAAPSNNHLSSLHHQSHLGGVLAAANEAAAAAATIGHHLNHHHTTSGTTSNNFNGGSYHHQLGHLFQFPNSMLSAAAAASLSSQQPQANNNNNINNHHHHHLHPTSHLSHRVTKANNSSGGGGSINQLPSIREQISLVDEIYQVGPLAIYAWLKAEQFDLQRVRDLIEISRTPYNNLLDLKSKYRLNSSSSNSNNNNENNNISHSNNHDNYLPLSINDNGKSSSETSEELSSGNKPRDRQSSPVNNSITTLSTLVAKSSPSSALSLNFQTLPSSAPINELSSAQLYTQLGNNNYPTKTYSNGIVGTNSNSNNSCEDVQTTTTPASISASNQHSMPGLANSLNPIPITTAPGLFWPSLKLATSGAAAAIHPHHLLPHFVHHPFVTHPIHHHHHHQQHHHQQQMSPTVTNSSPSASSSSTVL